MNIYVLTKIIGHVDIVALKQYLDLADEDTHAAHKKASPTDKWQL